MFLNVVYGSHPLNERVEQQIFVDFVQKMLTLMWIQK